jgi:hypothetical protein
MTSALDARWAAPGDASRAMQARVGRSLLCRRGESRKASAQGRTTPPLLPREMDEKVCAASAMTGPARLAKLA